MRMQVGVEVGVEVEGEVDISIDNLKQCVTVRNVRGNFPMCRCD